MTPRRRISTLALFGALLSIGACGQQGTPAQADEWPKLQAIYAYEATPVTVKETPVDNPRLRMSRIEYTGPEGDSVKGFFSRPLAEGSYPCVLLLHGLTDSSSGRFDQEVAAQLADKGVAVLALDAPHHGARQTDADRQIMLKVMIDTMKATTKGDLAAQIHEVDKDRAVEKLLAETIRQGIKDYRRGIDWLVSRKDIKADRIGALGYSLGSIMSSILAGVDARVRSVALCVGGDPILPFLAGAAPETKERTLATAASLYIGHLGGRSLLMLNGKSDTVIPKSATDRLYEAARDPKEIRWFDSGHTLPPAAIQEAVTWMVNELKGK